MSLSTRSNKRFEGTITVDPKYMGKLIGSGGCNIRRITSEVRAGCYIRGKDDTFTISAWTSQAVKKAAEMLKRDYAALLDPSKGPLSLLLSSLLSPLLSHTLLDAAARDFAMLWIR